MKKMTLLLSLTVGLTALSTSAFAVGIPFTALGMSDIFNAGGGTVEGDGSLPTSISFAAGGGTLTFSGVTGTVSCGPFCTAQVPGGNGADGGAYTGLTAGATNITSTNGISGISFNGREMFLVGVFLDNNVPSAGTQPATLAYTPLFADSATVFSPLIAQVFDIGNGLTGGPTDPPGIAQTYNIPVTATRLFFGFADANGFVGAPGMYFDDTGSISGNVNLSLNPAPEPGTMLLLGLGFAGLGLLRRKLT